MRPRPRRGDRPHAQADLLRTVDYGGRWPRPLGEILDQVVGHRVPLSLGHRHIDVLHHADDSAPALGRVARTHPVDVKFSRCRIEVNTTPRTCSVTRPIKRSVKLAWSSPTHATPQYASVV